MAESTSKPRRRLRFSLQTLLIGIAVLAVLMGRIVNNAREQKIAVARIKESGGSVTYDFEKTKLKRPSVPVWLHDALGTDMFASVHTVTLIQLDDAEQLTHEVQKLPSVQMLLLIDSNVSDEGVARLAGLPCLKNLRLNCCPISDASLQHVAKIRSLESLDLRGTKVTDSGLEHLRDSPNLKEIYLWATQTTLRGAQRLKASHPQSTVDCTQKFWPPFSSKTFTTGPPIPKYPVFLKNLNDRSPPVSYPVRSDPATLIAAHNVVRPQATESPLHLSVKERKILAALEGPTKLNFDNTALRDVADYVGAKYEIQVNLDSEGLVELSVDPTVPVTTSIKWVSLGTALQLILDDFSLTYIVENDALTITSKARAKSILSGPGHAVK